MKNVDQALKRLSQDQLDKGQSILDNYSYSVLVETEHTTTLSFHNDTTNFTVTLNFNSEGNLMNHVCSCNKGNLCEHVAAALLYLKDIDNKKLDFIDQSSFAYELLTIRKAGRYSSTKLKEALLDLLESYSEAAIINAFTNLYFFGDSRRDIIFDALLGLYVTGTKDEQLDKILYFTLSTLISIYSDPDKYKRAFSNDPSKHFLRAWSKSEYLQSAFVRKVYIDSINNGIIPKSIGFNTLMCHLSFSNNPDDIEITLDGLNVLSKNTDFFDGSGLLSTNVSESLIDSIVNNVNFIEKFKELDSVCFLFFEHSYSILKTVFKKTNNLGKDNASIALIKYAKESGDLFELVNFINITDLNVRIKAKAFLDSIVSPYSLYNYTSSLKEEKALADCNKDITISDISNLLTKNYPFKSHKNFFANKNVIIHDGSEPINKEHLFLSLKDIFENNYLLPENISSLNKALQSLPDEILLRLFYESEPDEVSRIKRFDLIDRLGFKKI